MGIFRPKKICFFRFPRVRTVSLGFPGAKNDENIYFFTRKNRNTGISSETTIPGISGETTIPGISSPLGPTPIGSFGVP